MEKGRLNQRVTKSNGEGICCWEQWGWEGLLDPGATYASVFPVGEKGELQLVYPSGRELLWNFMHTILLKPHNNPVRFFPCLSFYSRQTEAQKVIVFKTMYLVNSRSGNLTWIYQTPTLCALGRMVLSCPGPSVSSNCWKGQVERVVLVRVTR